MPVESQNFCPDCGEPLETRRVEGRHRQYCDVCDRPIYRNPKPVAGVLVVDGSQVLLVQRSEPPESGSWSLPAGFLEVDEPPLDAAVRELREETGVVVDGTDPELFDTLFREHPGRGHVLVLLYVAPRSETTGEPEARDDAAAARFWDRSEICARSDEIETGYAPLFHDAIATVEEKTGPHDF